MAEIRAVAFDLDGLMANTETLYRTTSAMLLQRRGHEPDDELFLRMMGHTNAKALQIMIEACSLDATVPELLEETNEIMKVLLERELKPNPGLYELIEELTKRLLPMGVVTNSLRHYAEDVLGRLGLIERFRWILSGQEIEHAKPDPAIYRLAADRFGVAPEQMMVLEDSEHGCVAAVGAGATVVVIPNEHNQHGVFEGAHLRADDLGDQRIVEMLSHLPGP